MNIFQRLARQWDALHPYNAVQVLHLQGPADLPALRRAWHEALDDLGLGWVQTSGRRYHHENLNGQAATHTVHPVSAGLDLDEFISRELNRPFDEAGGCPFRAFVLDAGGTHYAGVIYHHWVADSVSIRLLLREWFLRLHDPSEARRTPLATSADGYWKLLMPPRSRWNPLPAVFSSVQWSSRLKDVKRLPGSTFADFTARFLLHRLPEGCVDAVHAWARQHGATLNDVFLAAIAEACNQHMDLHARSRRQNLALGTIVDMRPYGRADLSETFGLFLGFTNVICRPEDLRQYDTLVRTIAAQNAHQKQQGIVAASTLRMFAGLAAGRLLSRPKLITFYRKRTPYAAGISNVNLRGSWAQQYHPAPLLDYIRVSPTGPMLPLVFTPTTLGNQLHFGLTYRPAVVSEVRIQAIVASFVQRLRQLAS